MALRCLDASSVLCPAAGGRSWGVRLGLLGEAFMYLKFKRKSKCEHQDFAEQHCLSGPHWRGGGGAVGRVWVLAPKCQ